ncbi:hypothetical protein [Ilumatobacter sp.]|uniref:hypothetical protein n=1 Tax=Ilumatobacter sp. TaxID=1967498 RepID=UPI003AF4F3DA
MHTVVVRVWLPDRPGALGQVASRIGSVRGDVLAIEILEIGGGRVIDELVVALPDPALVDLMVNEVHAIDGVSVEHVRTQGEGHVDASVLSLSAAAELAETDPADRVRAFLDGVRRLTEASWVMIASDGNVISSIGEVPSADWVTSLLAGSRHLGDPHATSSDMFWSDLPMSGLWVAAGRDGRTVHDRERVRLDLFARIADALLAPPV